MLAAGVAGRPESIWSKGCAAHCDRSRLPAVAAPHFQPHVPQLGSQPRSRLAHRLAVRPQAAPVQAPQAQLVYHATGVPLVDALMKMPTVESAVKHSAELLLVVLGGVIVSSIILRLIDNRLCSALAQARGKFDAVSATLGAIIPPAQALLPFYGFAYASTVVAALAQVAATKKKSEFNSLLLGYGDQVLTGIKWVAQFLQDTSELVLIIFAAWLAIGLKDRLFRWLAAVLTRDGEGEHGIVQLFNPLSAIVSFVILLVAGLTALSAYGVSVGPLMTSVGGLSVAVGLATQNVAANFVSAISLYSGRAFVVGDKVQLLARGSTVAEGYVVQIEPLRTVIRDRDGNPIYLSNTEVTSCAVRNFTQGGHAENEAPKHAELTPGEA